MITSSSDLLLTVVDDVLDYSKLESGDFKLNIEKIDLQLTLGTVLTSIQMKATKAERGIVVRPYVGVHVPQYIVSDSKRLQQIVYNLLGNAVKFSPDKGFVDVHVDTVGIRTSSPKLQITVKDYGIGIQEKNFDRIFEPFQQESAQVSTNYGGTGLGLPITRKLAKKLGGTVTVDSSLGHWTKFIVELPFRDEKAAIDGYIAQASTKMTVLIVNSTPTDACPLIKWLMEAGIEVHHMWNCGELSKIALRLETEKPELRRVYMTFIQDIDYQDTQYVEFAKNRQVALISFGRNNAVGRAAAYMPNPWLVFPSELLHFMSAFAHRLETNSSVPIARQEDCSMVVFNEEAIQNLLGASSRFTTDAVGSTHKSYKDLDLRVLIADDNKVNQKVLHRTLNRLGIEKIDIVDNGRLAVDAVEHSPDGYDLVLMDMEMPVLNGVDACREITEKNSETAPLIIFVTAHAMESHRLEGQKAGGSGFISKPFNLDMIDNALRSFRWEKRAQRSEKQKWIASNSMVPVHANV